MPTSSANFLIVIRRLSKITASMLLSVVDIFSAFLKPVIPELILCSVYSRLAKWHSQHFKYPGTFNLIFYTKLNIITLINFFAKKSKSTSKHDQGFSVKLTTNWQSKMTDTINICNRSVHHHNRKNMPKSSIRNSRSLKIMVIFWSHLVYITIKLFLFP